MALLRLAIPVLALSFLAAPGAGMAQYAPTQAPADEVAAARNCLCLQRSLQEAKFELDVRQGIFAKSVQDMQTLQAQVEQTRPTVNVENPAQVDAFRSLLARADAARDHYERVAGPDQQVAVARYNDAVQRSNAACQRPFSTYAWEGAQQNLLCNR